MLSVSPLSCRSSCGVANNTANITSTSNTLSVITHAEEETNSPVYAVKRLAWEYCGSKGLGTV